MKETQFDKFVQDVLEATREERIVWAATSNRVFAEDVMHGTTIFRSFRATYERKGEAYTLGYIERKSPWEYDDGVGAERRLAELLVFKDNKLILTVTEYHVDDLEQLGSLIGDQNKDAKSLLATF